jgi:hypothetical protein
MTAAIGVDRGPQSAAAAVAIRRFSGFLREYEAHDWRIRSECRRLRIGANLRRLSLQQAVVPLLMAGDQRAERADLALDRLDAALRPCATPGRRPVEPTSATVVAEAVSALAEALEELLRPAGVPDGVRRT